MRERVRRQGASGFTLIELLVVIATVPILVALLLPAVNGTGEDPCDPPLELVDLEGLLHVELVARPPDGTAFDYVLTPARVQGAGAGGGRWTLVGSARGVAEPGVPFPVTGFHAVGTSQATAGLRLPVTLETALTLDRESGSLDVRIAAVRGACP